jgi:hypothetical protein
MAAPCQYLQVHGNNDSVRFAWAKHLFRGINGSVLYTEHNNHQDLFGGIGYAAKTWLVGERQNLYITTGGKFFATDVIDARVSALGWHNLLRYEPRRTRNLQVVGELVYAPGFGTFGDGDRLWLIAGQMEYRILEQGDLVLGWRRIHTRFQGGTSADVDRGGYAGFAYRY